MNEFAFTGRVASEAEEMALCAYSSGDFAKAEKLYREIAIEMAARLGSNHVDVVCTLNSLASALERQAKDVEARSIRRRTSFILTSH